jgi:Na+/melibiose symporter-like transporter
MTYRNAPLLAERSEHSLDTVEAAPHHRAKQETVSHDTREEALQVVNAALKGLLLNRNFAWLVSGQAISNLGDFVFSTTLLIWVFSFTHEAWAVSGVLAAQYIPVFLLGPLAGVFVDRWDRRQTMLISDLIRAGAAMLPLLAPASLRLQAIYASVFLISAVGRFFLPAESGVLQVIVAERQQMQAASIKQAIFAFSIIGGPALAASLYFAVGPVLAMLINAVSYLVSAFCLARLRAPQAAFRPYASEQDEKGESGIGGVLRELFAGLKFVVVTRIVLMVTLMALISMLGAGAMSALNIVFVSKNLHLATAFYGVVTAVSGAGGLLGIILAGILSRWIAPRHILSGSALLIGVGFVIYSFQSWYVAGLVICFLLSIPQGGIQVAFRPLLINSTLKEMMGRVQAVVDTAMSGVSLISVILAASLGRLLPVGVILMGCGLLIALAGLFGWFAIREQAPAPALPRPHFA